VKRRGASWLALLIGVGALEVGILIGLGQVASAQPLEESVSTETELGAFEDVSEDYDPWESFNEPVFDFNYKLDKYFLKPVAQVYDAVVGDGEKQIIHNVIGNVAMPKRFVNSLLQGKWGGAGRELARFVINSTLGGAGMTDVAKYQFGIEPSNEDTGQTFGVHGWIQSRYLVLPFLPPLTLRDGVGYVFDLALDPLTYVLPFSGSAAKFGTNTVNERARYLESFHGVEEASFDLYSSVRNVYLKRREQQINE